MRDLAKAIGVEYNKAFKFEKRLYKVNSYTNNLVIFNTYNGVWEPVDYKDDPELLWRMITSSPACFITSLQVVKLTKKELDLLNLLDANTIQYHSTNEIELFRGPFKIGVMERNCFPSLEKYRGYPSIKKDDNGDWVVW